MLRLYSEITQNKFGATGDDSFGLNDRDGGGLEKLVSEEIEDEAEKAFGGGLPGSSTF